ncbi:hypothetical protein OKX02_06475 [Lacticaseibacillus paracasei]|uniref:hypothetical protein n=1 Tax=Lacticaseibacillus paracasei TaxID=1597 RepID=UPI0022312B1D|nr:hypothetical protein [Lacticaseibacillus paracasei]UZD27258.1 hypothetical protein OKX02_06475 [Lacticaseibacillus paracasei]
MNEELKQHALRIAEILQEQGNPYQRIEIDADGIKRSLLIGRNQQRPPKTRQS